MGEDCSRSFNTGILFGFTVCFLLLIAYFVLVISPTYDFDLIPKNRSMTEQMRYISGQWDDCWLSIGLDDNALYWKCDRFSSKIGSWVCTEQDYKEASP